MGEFDEFVGKPSGEMVPSVNHVTIRPGNAPGRVGEFDEFVTPHPKAGPTTDKPSADKKKSWWDVPGMAYRSSAKDLVQFFKAVRNTYQHPIDSAEALISGIGKAPELLRNAAGGMALNALTPDVRQMVVGNNTDLQKMSDTGSSLANAPKAVHDYAVDNYGSQEAWIDSLGNHPFRSAADLSTVLTGPNMLAAGAGLAARGAGMAARAGVLGASTGARAAKLAEVADKVAKATALPAKIGDAVNPINFVPDAPGNLLMGAGAMSRGLGAERIGNFLSATGNAIKPTEAINNLTGLYVSRAIAPEARVFLDSTNNQAPQVVSALEDRVAAAPGTTSRAGDIVPGSTPTGPEAVANIVNAPRLQVLGEEAKKNQVELNKALIDKRLAAQQQHLQTNISGSPAERQAAIAKRDADKARDYPRSDATVFTADRPMVDVLQRPELADVIRQAKEDYANKGRVLDLTYTPAHSVPTGLVDASGNPIMRNVPAVYPQLSGDVVDHLKKLMDSDAFERIAKKGASDPSVAAIRDARKAFLDLVDRPGFNPHYRRSRENFAANSRVIDQQNTGVHAESLLDNPHAFDASQDNIQNIHTRNPSIQAATGHTRYAHHADYLEPDQQNAMRAISADNARAAEAKRQASLASDYRDEIDSAFEPVHSPHIMGVKGKIAAALYNTAIGDINPDVAAILSKALMTPEGTLELGKNALAQQSKLSGRAGKAKLAGNVVRNLMIRNPTMYNILDYKRNAMNEMLNQRLGTDKK